MTLLIAGVILWIASHLFRRVLPGAYASLGPAARPVLIALAVLSLVLMYFGYRQADGTFYWGRTPPTVGINNLLMLASVYMFAASGMKTLVAQKLHHPMMVGVLLWTAAHILVNGDTPSFVLFGGMAVWAVLTIIVQSATVPWVRPVGKGPKMEIIAIVGTLIVYGAIAGVHTALGYPTFG